MASDLVRANGKNPDGVYFPFSENPGDFDEMVKRRRFDRAEIAAVQLLKVYRPYRNGNEALRALHDLDVDDKHKALIPASQSANTPPYEFRDVDGITELVLTDQGPSPLQLVFPEGTLGGQELLPALEGLVELTTGIVEAFEALAAL
jgi:hypothetical protein